MIRTSKEAMDPSSKSRSTQRITTFITSPYVKDFNFIDGNLLTIALQEAHNSDSAFTVKRLHSRSREIFLREVDALKRLSGQKHIVLLLATFEYKNSYYLLFPWANANLQRYWAMFPSLSIDRRYGL